MIGLLIHYYPLSLRLHFIPPPSDSLLPPPHLLWYDILFLLSFACFLFFIFFSFFSFSLSLGRCSKLVQTFHPLQRASGSSRLASVSGTKLFTLAATFGQTLFLSFMSVAVTCESRKILIQYLGLVSSLFMYLSRVKIIDFLSIFNIAYVCFRCTEIGK